jgi:hypothetical protein
VPLVKEKKKVVLRGKGSEVQGWLRRRREVIFEPSHPFNENFITADVGILASWHL